ncbi:hypothetical protein ABK046_52665, partial [Streptomyces caeruleatus]
TFQRTVLEQQYPEVAKTYQAKIDRAIENSDLAKAARWGKHYDNALVGELVLDHYDAFNTGYKLDGPRYDAKTGRMAG